MSKVQPILSSLADAMRQATDLMAVQDGLLSAAPVAFGCWDEMLRCCHANALLETISALGAGNLHGATLTQTLPALAPQLEPVFRQVLDGAHAQSVYGEVHESGNDLAPYWMAVIYRMTLAQPHEKWALGMMLLDVSWQKRHELELEERAMRALAERQEALGATAIKDRQLAFVSHELRTPLAPVFLKLAELTRDPDTPESIRQALSSIQGQLTIQNRLIDDLMDVVRVGSGKLNIQREIVNMHALIEQAIEICRVEFEAANLSLAIDLAAQRFTVSADPQRILQILWNLLHNAVKFTPTGRTVFVATRNDTSAHDQSNELVVEIRDEGVGISAADLARIFEPFEQASDLTRRRMESGMGLGLAISRSLAAVQGGTLTASSAGPGHGSTFSLVLPVVEANVEARTRATDENG